VDVIALLEHGREVAGKASFFVFGAYDNGERFFGRMVRIEPAPVERHPRKKDEVI
jgi:hypothetical protein